MILNTLRLRQNGCYFPDDIFKCIFFSENVWISLKISLRFVPNGPINNIPALVQIMAWRRPGDKPLSETMASDNFASINSGNVACLAPSHFLKQCRLFVKWILWNKLKWNLIQNMNFSKNAYENIICKMLTHWVPNKIARIFQLFFCLTENVCFTSNLIEDGSYGSVHNESALV